MFNQILEILLGDFVEDVCLGRKFGSCMLNQRLEILLGDFVEDVCLEELIFKAGEFLYSIYT